DLLNEGLLATKNIRHAAIVRRKDGAVKVMSPGNPFASKDFKMIEETFALADKTTPPTCGEPGFRFNDSKYTLVRCDDESIYAKNGKAGVVVTKTPQFYVAATYTTSMHASIAVEAVEKLSDYLRTKAAKSGS
ncbi:profilin-4-like protein, partial [Caulochytrium protostelioides]